MPTIQPKTWASRFDDPGVFVSSLGSGDDRAVEKLFSKIVRPVEQMVRSAGLPRQEAEEMLNDVAMLFIQKIREGKYQLTEVPPHAYALGIANWLVKNRASKERNRRISPVELEIATIFRADESSENDFSRKDDAEFLRAMLEKLPKTNRQVIQLRYFDGYSDEEAVRLNLTHFKTVNSLKNRRKESLAKLREVARGIAPELFLA